MMRAQSGGSEVLDIMGPRKFTFWMLIIKGGHQGSSLVVLHKTTQLAGPGVRVES